jgi:hypothetical protein
MLKTLSILKAVRGKYGSISAGFFDYINITKTSSI